MKPLKQLLYNPSRLIFSDRHKQAITFQATQNSMAVITDSGGVTEETTVLNIPCITLRNSTERPETCSIGTNVLVGSDIDQLKIAFENLHSGIWKAGSIPPLWDGKASERIVNYLIEIFNL